MSRKAPGCLCDARGVFPFPLHSLGGGPVALRGAGGAGSLSWCRPRLRLAYSPREEGHDMTERQKEAWAGVLLGLMVFALLGGGLLVLRLTGN